MDITKVTVKGGKDLYDFIGELEKTCNVQFNISGDLIAYYFILFVERKKNNHFTFRCSYTEELMVVPGNRKLVSFEEFKELINNYLNIKNIKTYELW